MHPGRGARVCLCWLPLADDNYPTKCGTQLGAFWHRCQGASAFPRCPQVSPPPSTLGDLRLPSGNPAGCAWCGVEQKRWSEGGGHGQGTELLTRWLTLERRRIGLSYFPVARLIPPHPCPLPWGCAFPTSFPFPAQSRRDCVLQPRVASRELPWVHWASRRQPQRGCGFKRGPEAATPLGLAAAASLSQGSSRLATLGFETESLWDSPGRRCELWGMLGPWGEGEPFAALRRVAAFSHSQRRTAGHPLLRGEGWGEGELD